MRKSHAPQPEPTLLSLSEKIDRLERAINHVTTTMEVRMDRLTDLIHRAIPEREPSIVLSSESSSREESIASDSGESDGPIQGGETAVSEPHQEEEIPGKPYRCDECGLAFARSWYVARHKRTAHGSKCLWPGCSRAPFMVAARPFHHHLLHEHQNGGFGGEENASVCKWPGCAEPNVRKRGMLQHLLKHNHDAWLARRRQASRAR
ncbi:uncharacterized protein GGS25DRAFT_526488 [Hypoxylon fragiforme]|uniref:uncharacterized protein n=1 Tax=Hypoxylon fragiforme TaxID=63214 RepID=UPI0020C6248D|nr:uncharacterized protein GGS25DRAFT_526488 [Hypoxylon fragiforme]KAI2603453.1 hypothetical protein GGS25DRAFT_526488 [Hypoxylon fragiforme]